MITDAKTNFGNDPHIQFAYHMSVGLYVVSRKLTRIIIAM